MNTRTLALILSASMVACMDTSDDKSPLDDTDTDTDTMETDDTDTVETDDTDTMETDTDETDTDETDTDETDTDVVGDQLIVVTNVSVPSGFFSESNGALGETFVTTENTNCGTRPAGARGSCWEIAYNRDPDSNGAGPSFWGGFFLDPATDVNGPWENGLKVQLGGTATSVTFYAWGAAGGELVNFKAGIGPDANGGEINTDVTLTTTPTMYTIDVSARGWTEVWGVFGFGVTEAPLNDTEFTFYIDDVVWN